MTFGPLTELEQELEQLNKKSEPLDRPSIGHICKVNLWGAEFIVIIITRQAYYQCINLMPRASARGKLVSIYAEWVHLDDLYVKYSEIIQIYG